MILAVLDTNILASGALTSTTIPGQLLNKWQDGQFQLILSSHILDELERTLNNSYFQKKINPSVKEEFFHLLQEEAILVPISRFIPTIATHPEDDMILATAESGKADYIVTGDHGLQSLKQFKGIPIMNARIFAEVLGGENEKKKKY